VKIFNSDIIRFNGDINYVTNYIWLQCYLLSYVEEWKCDLARSDYFVYDIYLPTALFLTKLYVNILTKHFSDEQGI